MIVKHVLMYFAMQATVEHRQLLRHSAKKAAASLLCITASSWSLFVYYCRLLAGSLQSLIDNCLVGVLTQMDYTVSILADLCLSQPPYVMSHWDVNHHARMQTG